MKLFYRLIAFLFIVVSIFGCMYGANWIQRSTSSDVTVDIRNGSIETSLGTLAYKLYVPSTATPTSKAPAVLLLHGYQNDHETCSAYAIELSRRGAVVLSVDEYGHGSTDIGLLERGYVNHKVTVNYGEDSEASGTYVTGVGGAERYRLMMNFSNLSFFDSRYSSDSDGNSIKDSSCGGIDAYRFLADLDFVDSSRMGVSGHSMGTWSSWSVAAKYSGSYIAPKAIVLQCGELFRKSAYDSDSISFNNVLLLQAKYDEFSYFRDYRPIVSDEMLDTALRKEFLGISGKAAWNTTYGSFSDGTARRMELLITNHRLTTHNGQGITAAIEWFTSALGLSSDIKSSDHVYMTKELLVFAAMLITVFATIPLANMLLSSSFFGELVQELPTRAGIKTGRKWLMGAIIGILLSGLSYPFMTQLGHGLLPVPEKVFRMTIGNGFLSWYGLLAIIFCIMTVSFIRKEKKRENGTTYSELGMAESELPDRFSWKLTVIGLLLSCVLFAFIYLINMICELLFALDLRFIWPFFRSFNMNRFGQFLVYIPVYCLFFILTTSRSLALMRTESTYTRGIRGFLGTWFKTALQMTGGVVMITLLEYIPFFANIGPGADLLFGSTFGGPFMSLLIVFLPQVVVFSLLCTYFYRRTGNIFTGAFLSATLACWIVTGGSSILY